MGEERAIQFLKYHLWDAERCILENPGEWRYLVLEDYGSLPCDLKAAARRIYDYAVRQKLERIKELGFDLTEIYERLTKKEADQ